jgi:hypothetical protein
MRQEAVCAMSHLPLRAALKEHNLPGVVQAANCMAAGYNQWLFNS